MKREELTAAGLTDEQIEKVMKLNGDDINREKSKYSDYDDVKKQLEKANATIDGMKDYDAVKADVAKYQQEAESAKKEAAAKVQQFELQAKVKDFTSGKKFVNRITQESITAKMCEALGADESKGKNLDDIFAEITKDQTDILKDDNAPTPPTVPAMGGKGGKSDDDAQARAVMGLAPKNN